MLDKAENQAHNDLGQRQHEVKVEEDPSFVYGIQLQELFIIPEEPLILRKYRRSDEQVCE